MSTDNNNNNTAVKILTLLLDKLTFTKILMLFLFGASCNFLLYLYEHRADAIPLFLSSDNLQVYVIFSFLLVIIGFFFVHVLKRIDQNAQAYREHVGTQIMHLKNEINYLREIVDRFVNR